MLHFLNFASTPEPDLIHRAFAMVAKRGEFGAVQNAALAAVKHQSADPTLIVDVALPAITLLSAAGLYGWIRELSMLAYQGKLDNAFDDPQRRAVLGLMIGVPRVDFDDEQVLEVLTRGDRAALIGFFVARLANEGGDDPLRLEMKYEALPFALQTLSALPDLDGIVGPLVATTFAWYEREPLSFPYLAGRLVSILFPTLSNALVAAVRTFLDSGAEQAPDYAIRMLRAYRGEPTLLELAKAIVTVIAQDDARWGEIEIGLSATGVVSGEFGFVEAYQRKIAEIEPWLDRSLRVPMA